MVPEGVKTAESDKQVDKSYVSDHLKIGHRLAKAAHQQRSHGEASEVLNRKSVGQNEEHVRRGNVSPETLVMKKLPPLVFIFRRARCACFCRNQLCDYRVATENPKPAPAVCLAQPADYLCAVVTIRSAAKDPEKQANAMRETLQRVTAAVEKSSRYQLHQGAVRFAGNSSSSYGKTSVSPATLQTSVRILSPLPGNNRCLRGDEGAAKIHLTFQARGFETDLNVTAVTLAVASPSNIANASSRSSPINPAPSNRPSAPAASRSTGCKTP